MLTDFLNHFYLSFFLKAVSLRTPTFPVQENPFLVDSTTCDVNSTTDYDNEYVVLILESQKAG